MQEQHAVGIGRATVDRVAAHHRNDVRILLGLVLPDDLAVIGEIEGVDDIRERRVHVHRVTDHQRRAFMPAQNAGRECPRDLQIADVSGIDLIQLGIPLVLVVARLDRPLRGVRPPGARRDLGGASRPPRPRGDPRRPGELDRRAEDPPSPFLPEVAPVDLARAEEPVAPIRLRTSLGKPEEPGGMNAREVVAVIGFDRIVM